MPETPVDTGDSRPRLSVVDAWLGPMSTTVREEYEVGDLDPAGVLEAAADSRTRPNDEPRSASSSWPPTGPTCTPPPPTPGSRPSVVPPSWPTSRSAATAPRRGRLHPGTVRPRLGHVPVGRGTADRRRPRPAPPPPDALETSRPVGGAGLAGPPGRPPDPPAVQGRRDLGRRTARRPRLPAAPSSSTGSSPRRSPPTTPRTHEDREDDVQGRLGRHPHPPRGHRLPRHLPPRSHRRHPGPEGRSTTRSVRSPTSCSSTATPHPLGVRKVKAIGILTGQPQLLGNAKVKAYVRVDVRDLDRRRRRLHARRR